MAEPQPSEGSSMSGLSGGSSDSTLQLNIKTLDSRIYSIHVDKDWKQFPYLFGVKGMTAYISPDPAYGQDLLGMLGLIVVSEFKEKIANQSGVPVALQRLIFRGKVLKDDHPLSEYNVEHGDTLHLVERQPQPASGTGQAAPENGSREHDSNAGSLPTRIGPIAHSIVLGTLNVGDQGEAGMPDLNRIIGAVLNNVGMGHQAGFMQHGVASSFGNEAEDSWADVRRDGDPSVPSRAVPGQSASRATLIPLGATIAVPSVHMPLPDSLSTLVEFMNRMELTLSQNGNQPNESTPSGSRPSVELPLNAHGLPTVEALRIVLKHTQSLLTDHAVPALSHSASRLSDEGGSNDPVVRGQIQSESAQFGIAMQHLGSLFLELGRTLLTLRIGQSPGESIVNAGPAVYISPSGPNPVMVQPFPLQTSSLFSGSSSTTSNNVSLNTVGVSSIPRNLNIHIHTGASLGPAASAIDTRSSNGEGQHINIRNPRGAGRANGSSGQTTGTAVVPSQSTTSSFSGTAPPGTGVSQTPDTQVRSLFPGMQNENHVTLGDDITRQNIEAGKHSHTDSCASEASDQKVPDGVEKMGVSVNSGEPSLQSVGGSHDRPSVNQDTTNPGGSFEVPLGLGLGGLQPKRRARQARLQTIDGDGGSQSEQSRAVGLHVLQSLASASNREHCVPLASPQAAVGTGGTGSRAIENSDDEGDAADAMSQLFESPALDGLLAGVSQQTGVGSPDMFRSMLQQFTQNPAMRNTVNQIAQQVDSHDLGSMFSGLGGGPGGGIDLSAMMQQMMPIVSQALGGVSSGSRITPPMGPVLSQNRSRIGVTPTSDSSQINLRPVVQSPLNQDSSEAIFHSLVDQAATLSLSDVGRPGENVADELSSEKILIQEFTEMLRRDISKRLQDEMGS